MGKVGSHGLMEVHTMVNSKRIIFRDMELITGQTAECSSVHGSIIKWKDTGRSRGQMAESMKVTILMIKKKGKEHSTGPTAENMKEAGKMVNNMAMDSTHRQVVKLNKEDGTKEKDFIGSIMPTKTQMLGRPPCEHMKTVLLQNLISLANI